MGSRAHQPRPPEDFDGGQKNAGDDPWRLRGSDDNDSEITAGLHRDAEGLHQVRTEVRVHDPADTNPEGAPVLQHVRLFQEVPAVLEQVEDAGCHLLVQVRALPAQ